MSDVQPLARKEIILGRFRVEKRLAAGAMGEVWSGEHTGLKLRVALKVLRKEMLLDDEIVTRFAREAFLLGQIRSDYVARVLDFVDDSKHGPILVMELIEGPSLAKALKDRQLTVEQAVDLGIDLANALRDVHAARVLHRDVKPSNIMLRPLSDGRSRAVFVDLGVSRHMPDVASSDEERLTEITSADRAVGTIEYMAPEQILSSRNVTPAADLYALGAILFRAVSGSNVFGDLRGMELARLKIGKEPPPPLQTGRSDRVAAGLESIVMRALACSPADRYESAEELLTELSLLRDAAQSALREAERQRKALARASLLPPLPPKRLWTLPPRIQKLAAVWGWRAAALCAGLVVGAVFGALIGRHATTKAEIDSGRCTVAHRMNEGKTTFSIVCDEKE